MEISKDELFKRIDNMDVSDYDKQSMKNMTLILINEESIIGILEKHTDSINECVEESIKADMNINSLLKMIDAMTARIIEINRELLYQKNCLIALFVIQTIIFLLIRFIL